MLGGNFSLPPVHHKNLALGLSSLIHVSMSVGVGACACVCVCVCTCACVCVCACEGVCEVIKTKTRI